MSIDKEKQKKGVIQDKEVFLYKLYTILSESSKPKTLEYSYKKRLIIWTKY